MSKEYCKRCGQVLHTKRGFLANLMNNEPTYQEFEDGYYCIPCTKIKVKEART